MTLGLGDVVFTAREETTGGEPGDSYEVEIEGVGVLGDTVVAEPR